MHFLRNPIPGHRTTLFPKKIIKKRSTFVTASTAEKARPTFSDHREKPVTNRHSITSTQYFTVMRDFSFFRAVDRDRSISAVIIAKENGSGSVKSILYVTAARVIFGL